MLTSVNTIKPGDVLRFTAGMLPRTLFRTMLCAKCDETKCPGTVCKNKPFLVVANCYDSQNTCDFCGESTTNYVPLYIVTATGDCGYLCLYCDNDGHLFVAVDLELMAS